MEYIIVFKLWQSWLFLFAVALICMLIGYLICRLNFYAEFTDSYKRSRAKLEIGLTSLEIDYLKTIIDSTADTIFVCGGTKVEREGMVDYIRSFRQLVPMFCYYGIPTIKEFAGIQKSVEGNHCIVTTMEEPNLVNCLQLISEGMTINTVVYISTMKAKTTAVIYCFNKDTGEFETVKENTRVNVDKEN